MEAAAGDGDIPYISRTQRLAYLGILHRVKGDALVIPNLLVRDYPLVVRLSPIKRVFLPLVLRNPH
jgi:hypothetical protein